MRREARPYSESAALVHGIHIHILTIESGHLLARQAKGIVACAHGRLSVHA